MNHVETEDRLKAVVKGLLPSKSTLRAGERIPSLFGLPNLGDLASTKLQGIPEFLHAANKVCPFILGVPAEMETLFKQGVCVRAELGEKPPENFSFLASPGGGIEWWADKALGEFLFYGANPLYVFNASTLERLLKYMGSFVCCEAAELLSQEIAIPLLSRYMRYDEENSQFDVTDGILPVRRSLLTTFKSGGVGRLLTNLLYKGTVIPLNDAAFPKGYDALPGESKAMIGRTDGKVIAFRPGHEMESTDDSVLGQQSLLAIWGEELTKATLQRKLEARLSAIKGNLDEYVNSALKGELSLEEEVDETESRDQALHSILQASGVNSFATPEGTNALLRKLQRDVDPSQLRFPGSCFGGPVELFSGYPMMSPARQLADLWTRTEGLMPEQLMELANWEEAAPKFLLKKGKDGIDKIIPIVWITQKVADRFGIKDGIHGVAYRIPTGTTSGALVQFRILDAEIVELYRWLGWRFDFTLLACPECFKAFWSANEGGDCDDRFWFAIGELGALAWQGIQERDAFMRDNALEADKLLEKIKAWEEGFHRRTYDGPAEVLAGYYDVSYEWNISPAVETGSRVEFTAKRRVVSFATPEPYVAVSGKLSSGDLWLAANRHQGNPYAPTIGEAANAIMFGNGIRLGLGQVHHSLAKDRKALACLLMRSDVSLCVDAANTGEKFTDAWKSIQQTRLVLLYMANASVQNPPEEPLQVLQTLKARMGNSLNAVHTQGNDYTFCFIKGEKAWRLLREEDGLPAVQVGGPLSKIHNLGHFPKNRPFVHHRLLQCGLEHMAWAKTTVTELVEQAKGDPALRLLVAALETEVGRNPTARAIAAAAVQKAYAELHESGLTTRGEISRRYEAVKRISGSKSRDAKTVRFLRKWANLPLGMAFASVYKYCRDAILAIEGLELQERKDMMDSCLLATSLLYLRQMKNGIMLSEDRGRIVAHRSGWSSAFRTDSKFPAYRGPWSAIYPWLAKYAKANALAACQERTTVTFAMLKSSKAEGLDLTSLVGMDIQDLLGITGLSLALKESFAEQDPAVHEAATICFKKIENLSKEERETFKGKTKWEIATMRGYEETLRLVCKGNVESVTETTLTSKTGKATSFLVIVTK